MKLYRFVDVAGVALRDSIIRRRSTGSGRPERLAGWLSL
jgi:hypothetical protein